MKKTIVCILSALSLTAMCSCDNAELQAVEPSDTNTSMFIEVERELMWKVVYHKETKVMYAVSYGSYNYGTFTLLVNADGTPMLYNG